ncbi:conserved hypothetical protein [Talaromyces stipitatus ATCC 10500]|uniref:Uncharacterized protein n=1 Tax=Talaromyces stipitatus (strain ATCC 10500 / CBS 375.48 / QM 6759 / NRRL 1006) TaxID=441959 RepID=B8MF55_TALSN|nr:uncharacterized protein TSTA_012620 [Talaromyces stipitatus ATCC 10500]EED16154.1 conserved hypothetical protein [Talaromyces stipitatus ATCC 10500]
MHTTVIIIIALSLFTSSTPLPSPPPNLTTTIHNANHIFNALHSSMRQWGSAWNHNGMSFFLASVPKGTQFYHGTQSSQRVNGTEWLAFEPEHALSFAYAGPFPHPDPEKPSQKVFAGDEGEVRYGYLHTYTAAKDLRLLYIDGLSAGKTDMGTLDSGDRVFLRDSLSTPSPKEQTPHPNPKKKPGLPTEYERALKGCQIAKNDWQDRIHGILRAEAGFEIILCDFARDLDLVRISAVPPRRQDRNNNGWFGGNSYFYRSIASRFHQIGGERVRVNYDRFVTAFAHEELDLFDKGKNEMPRLIQFRSEELEAVREELTRLVMEHDVATEAGAVNWQAVVDMIVTKYSDLLQFFISKEVDSLMDMKSNVSSLYVAFVDDRKRDVDAESVRCAMQFIPSTALDRESLAGRVVYDISYTICSTLRAVLDDVDVVVAKSRIERLVEYLAWTTWKDCKTKCGYNEVCYIPIWPFGTVEDRVNPRCKSPREEMSGGERYWRDGGLKVEHGELQTCQVCEELLFTKSYYVDNHANGNQVCNLVRPRLCCQFWRERSQSRRWWQRWWWEEAPSPDPLQGAPALAQAWPLLSSKPAARVTKIATTQRCQQSQESQSQQQAAERAQRQVEELERQVLQQQQHQGQSSETIK